MRDLILIALIASGCSGLVGLLGLGMLRLLRRRSTLVSLAAVAALTVCALVAGMLGVAVAMFLSPHDFQVLVVVCVIGGLVSVGIALMLGRQVVTGSRALQAATRALGEDGRFAAPAAPPTAELAALSRELEVTSARLAESRRREQALETSRRELVAWVSHDLRTPLAGLRAMAEALEDGVAADPDRYHKQIRIEVDRLAAMVDDLFELSRIHAGALHLSLDRIPLSDLVSDALAGADALARAQGVRLQGQAESRIAVEADGRELSRVLTNLVVNAIRHTPSDGTVRVEVNQTETATGDRDGAGTGVAVLSVTDSCGGIPDNDLARVFDVGWRGSAARTPQPDGGAGLGLAIVRGIVEAHKGHVSVANVGTGCRFEVRLPLLGQ